MSDQTSRVLTLVFTDLANSTALKTARGDAAVDVLVMRHREHVNQLAAECRGRIISWAGDGCFLSFETSSAGVMFALRLQQVHTEEFDLPGVRVGIHMGEVTEKRNPDGEHLTPSLDGLSVDLAARISALASPGQVLVSSAVYASARQRLGVEALGKPLVWQTHGTYELKGFDEPIDIGEAALEGAPFLGAPKSAEKARLVRRAKRRSRKARLRQGAVGRVHRPRRFAFAAVPVLAIIAATALFFSRDAFELGEPEPAPTDVLTRPPITSLAVLPLNNFSNDPEQEYFSDGMTEAITSELAKIASLKVISRTSVMRYKDTHLSIPEIAQELDVEGIIEGSVLREADDVRITVQLIDARNDEHVWAESYTNTITSVLKLQSEVALAIVDAIQAKLTPDERERIATAELVNREAYELYLRATALTTEITPMGYNRVRDLVMRSLEIDPEFAPAWALLGVAELLRGNIGLAPPRPQNELSVAHFRRALEHDPELAEAQLVAIPELLLTFDWESAETGIERALGLSPNHPEVHRAAASIELARGNWADALSHGARALELNPQSADMQAEVGVLYTFCGYPERGRQLLQALVDGAPRNPAALAYLTVSLLSAGEYKAAIQTAERFVQVSMGTPISRAILATAYALDEQTDRARDLLDQLLAQRSTAYVSPFALSGVFAALGDVDKALDWSERAIDEPVMFFLQDLRNLFMWSAYPHGREMLERLLNDRRYWALIERIGFPPLPPDHPLYEFEQAWLAQKAAEQTP